MKQPYQIYHDEFMREVNRHAKTPIAGSKREISQAAVTEAERVAAEAAAQHMVDVLRFSLERVIAA